MIRNIRSHRENSKFVDLDEKDWWSGYYQCLEREIALLPGEDQIDWFASDLSEIACFKKDSSPFKSRYYVIQGNRSRE